MTEGFNPIAVGVFALFVALSLWITWWAARRTRTRKDFYAAGSSITGPQNGLAIAGDFMSAATFLGITGVVFMLGFDGLILAVGIMAGWPVMLFVLSERIRNLGRFTFVDVVSYRFEDRPVRILFALSSLCVVIFYLVGQMVGAGKLIEILFGLDYNYAVFIVTGLIILYVTLGGMFATTWVQIVKALLLLIGGAYLGFAVLMHYGFDASALFADAARVHAKGAAVLGPGLWLKDPVSIVTVALTMMFGIMGLPHILMRFFTVKDAREARTSVAYATVLMGFFYLLIIVIGYGAVALITGNPAYMSEAGGVIGGNNMVSLHLAHRFGGDIMLGFMSAVTFATILAVVAGLTLSGAAAISHDLYANAFGGAADEETEVRVSRLSVVALGVLAALMGILFQDQNIAIVTATALAVAASVHFPVLLLAMYWPGMTTQGAVRGGGIGLLVSVVMIVGSPPVWTNALGLGAAWFPYPYPTIVAMPVAFAAIWLFSKADKSARSSVDKARYLDLTLRAETGFGAH